MTGNYQNVEHKSIRIALGDNEFKTGLVTVAANSTLKAGTIVKTVNGKFVPVTGSEETAPEGLGVLVDELTNGTASNADVAYRVLIAGRVNQNALLIGSSAATAAQADALRQWSIVPLTVTEMGKSEN